MVFDKKTGLKIWLNPCRINIAQLSEQENVPETCSKHVPLSKTILILQGIIVYKKGTVASIRERGHSVFIFRL